MAAEYYGKMKMVIYKTRRKTRRIGYENQKNNFSQSCLHVFDSSYGSYVIYSGSSDRGTGSRTFF